MKINDIVTLGYAKHSRIFLGILSIENAASVK